MTQESSGPNREQNRDFTNNLPIQLLTQIASALKLVEFKAKDSAAQAGARLAIDPLRSRLEKDLQQERCEQLNQQVA